MPETNTPAQEPSIADLRLLVSDTPEPEPKTPVVAAVDPKTETPETPETKADEGAAPGPAAEQITEAESVPAAVEVEAIEEELPAGVQKKIAKEVTRTVRAEQAIRDAISNRKAAEDKLAKLTADKSGSEPAKPTESATDGKPVRPDLETFVGDYAAYQAALNKYDLDHEAWLIAKTERAVEEKMTARQRDEALKRDWDEATEVHGADFPELMKTLAEAAPEGLQLAISGLDHWSTVAAHLAKTPDELKALSAKFAANPYAAVAELGRLEDRLQQASKPPEPAKTPPVKPAVKVLPTPPAKVGGAATAEASVDLEKADMRTFKREMRALLG